MKRSVFSAWHFPSLLLVSLIGCLPSAHSVVPMYFRPLEFEETADSPIANSGPSPRAVRLEPIRAASYLKERWAWRDGVLAGFHEDLRWTESPSNYVERALAQALFETTVARRDPRGDVLSVEVVAFDQIRAAPIAVLVEARASLVASDGLRTIWEKTFRMRAEVEGNGPEAIAREMGNAMSTVVENIVIEVVSGS